MESLRALFNGEIRFGVGGGDDPGADCLILGEDTPTLCIVA